MYKMYSHLAQSVIFMVFFGNSIQLKIHWARRRNDDIVLLRPVILLDHGWELRK
jgi:hypothetical protein